MVNIMSRVTLGEVEINVNTFNPSRFVYVDGIKTQCAIDIEAIQDDLVLHGLDIKDELPQIIVEDLKHLNVTIDEVVKMLDF